MATKTYYDFDTEFTFGKYAGKEVHEVLDIDPQYLEWCINNLENICFFSSVVSAVKTAMKKISSTKTTNKFYKKY